MPRHGRGFAFAHDAPNPNRATVGPCPHLAERGCVGDQPQHWRRAAAGAARTAAPGNFTCGRVFKIVVAVFSLSLAPVIRITGLQPGDSCSGGHFSRFSGFSTGGKAVETAAAPAPGPNEMGVPKVTGILNPRLGTAPLTISRGQSGRQHRGRRRNGCGRRDRGRWCSPRRAPGPGAWQRRTEWWFGCWYLFLFS